MSPSRPKTTERQILFFFKQKTAYEMARMSAWSALAMVGRDTMNTRVAKPEMNCPIMALTRSSTSVRAVIERRLRILGRQAGGETTSARASRATTSMARTLGTVRRFSDVHPHHAAADQPVGDGLV